MTQSASPHAFPGLHVGIIMDGNGRWATRSGRPRAAKGTGPARRAVRRVVEAAPGVGIGTLTLFAFSADNWHRPALEVRALMRLFREYLRAETPRCVRNGVRLEVIGRRDRLDAGLVRAHRARRAGDRGGAPAPAPDRARLLRARRHPAGRPVPPARPPRPGERRSAAWWRSWITARRCRSWTC